MRSLRYTTVALTVSGASLSVHAEPRLDPYGWPIVDDADVRQMQESQVRLNQVGDLIRNLAAGAQALVSVGQGASEAAQMTAEGLRDLAIEKQYEGSVPPLGHFGLTDLAKAYSAGINAAKSQIARSEPGSAAPPAVSGAGVPMPSYGLTPLDGGPR